MSFVSTLAVLVGLVFSSSGGYGGDIVIDSPEYDFGDVMADSGTLFHTFRLTNVSGCDFRVGGISTGCSCVSAYLGLIYVPAGETVDLKVSVKPGGHGRKEYEVNVYDSDERKAGTVLLKMNVIDTEQDGTED